ncbi:CBR-LGC-26 protein [Ditylenchus destructor]|nr:CBR-LGC-26 protein [Ditylenchus destructor]
MNRAKKKRWELLDSWQKHCYWGPNGCTDDMPIGPLDNYWSLLEFGVRIRRHAPYYGLSMVLPTIITGLITLLVFWVEDLPLAISLSVFNVILQCFSGWALVQQLPPGNGQVPKIAKLYAWNVLMTAATYIIHTVLYYLLYLLPEDADFPLRAKLRELTTYLRSIHFFQVQGLSFDPQAFIFDTNEQSKQQATNGGSGSADNAEAEMEPIMVVSGSENQVLAANQTEIISLSNREDKASHTPPNDTIVELDLGNYPTTSASSLNLEDYTAQNDTKSLINATKQSTPAAISNDIKVNQSEFRIMLARIGKSGKMAEEFYILRRLIFAIFLCMFLIMLLMLLF